MRRTKEWNGSEKRDANIYQPIFQPGVLRDPVWYEGQTVFEMGNGRISWKNRIYECGGGFIKEAEVVEENREKSIVKVNLARDAFIHKLKIVSVTILIYTPILLCVLSLFK